MHNILRRWETEGDANPRITSLSSTICWYNVICSNCDNLVSKKGVHWFCTTHAKITNPKFRFSLNALIADTTSETGICLSDEVSQKLCGFSCSEIIAQVGSENRKTIPNVFDETMNKTKVFYLQLMRNSKPKRLTYVAIDIQSDTPTPIPPTPATPSSTPPPASTPPSTVRTETKIGKRLQYDDPDVVNLPTPSKRPRTEE
ncbi:hypothetical protein LXL04_009661 [Taraxacum kok-saghyz]